MDDLSVSMTTEEESIYCLISANIHKSALILAYGLDQHPQLFRQGSKGNSVCPMTMIRMGILLRAAKK